MYAQSGVNVEEGNRVVQYISDAVKSTWDTRVKSRFGDFAGIFEQQGLQLVASTDGVGTKTVMTLDLLGPELGLTFLGQDIVNHCVNDILVKGAEPLFFLDYIASSKLCADHVRVFIDGVSAACRDAGCALLGGETAEMPDVYNPGHIDIVGTIVGMIKPGRLIDGPANITVGTAIIGLRSSGPHTNGYSLIRKVLPRNVQNIDDVSPHKCYLPDIRKIWAANVNIKALVHITGGGWWDNIKRALPAGTSVDIQFERKYVCETFNKVQRECSATDAEMLTVFNMGFGMLVFVNVGSVRAVQHLFTDDAVYLGNVVEGEEPRVAIT